MSTALRAAARAPVTKPEGFDYAGVAPELVADAQAVADRFRAYEQRTTADAIALGVELARIKDGIGHGRFGGWLEAEFGQSARTAQRLLSLTVFAPKSDSVSYLPPTTLYRLARVPEKPRARIIGQIEAERPSANVVLFKALNVERPAPKKAAVKGKREAIEAARAELRTILGEVSAEARGRLRLLILKTPSKALVVTAQDLA